MPRVHRVNKAKKDHPKCNVKAGESYYWWKQRLSPKGSGIVRCSKSYPRQSILTVSPFWSEVWRIKESISDAQGTIDNLTDLEALRDDIIVQIESLRDEAQSSLENIPEPLQESSVLQGRIEELENWIAEIENTDEPEEIEEFIELADECLDAFNYDLSCD
jgi:hypothetical protein